jgi:hypothetical protein
MKEDAVAEAKMTIDHILSFAWLVRLPGSHHGEHQSFPNPASYAHHDFFFVLWDKPAGVKVQCDFRNCNVMYGARPK